MKMLTASQSKDCEEHLLSRRPLLLSSLGTTNVEVKKSGSSEGLLLNAHDSEFECADHGDDSLSERDSSSERFCGPVLPTARRSE